jgi:ABC-type proline/glycine betaine transport system substrate-binding protein
LLPLCLGCAEQELSPRRRDRVALEYDLAQQAEKAERWLLWWGAQGYDLAQQAEEAARWLPHRSWATEATAWRSLVALSGTEHAQARLHAREWLSYHAFENTHT